MKAKISIVTLGVADLERARRFYEDGLGLPRHAFDSDDIVFFDLEGRMMLALFGRAALAADAGVADAPTGFSGITLAHNVGSREEVDAIVAAAVAAGASVPKPAEDKEWGGYSAYVADPDGHLWEIAWNEVFDLT